MSRLWIKVMRKHKITMQLTVPCDHDEIEEKLVEACKQLDIASPMWLGKQRSEMEKFDMTSFAPSDFIEAVRFEKLEVNWLADDNVTHRSTDPRNDFS